MNAQLPPWTCPTCGASVEGSACFHRRPEPAAAPLPAPPDPASRSGGRPAAPAAPGRPTAAGAPRPSALLRAVAPQLEAHGRAWCETATDEQLEALAERLSAWEPSVLRRLHSLASKALARSWAAQHPREA